MLQPLHGNEIKLAKRVVVGAGTATTVDWPAVVGRKDDESVFVHVLSLEKCSYVADRRVEPVPGSARAALEVARILRRIEHGCDTE